MLSVGQNLGMFVGPPVVGAVIAGGNWEPGVIPLVVAIAIGVVASLLLHKRRLEYQVSDAAAT